MDTNDQTPDTKAAKIKAETALVTVLMPAVAADAKAATPARGVYLATVAASDIPAGAVIIGVASGPNTDGTIALIDPVFGVMIHVPAADIGLYPDHARAVAGVHIPA